MPFKNPEQKKAHMREWRKRKIEEGYGKWLYARRKVIYENEAAFHEAIGKAIDLLDINDLEGAREILAKALREAMERGDEIGSFTKEEEEPNERHPEAAEDAGDAP